MDSQDTIEKVRAKLRSIPRLGPAFSPDRLELGPDGVLLLEGEVDSDALRDWLKDRGTEPVIPPRSNRKVQYHYDKALYRTRNVIERSFGRLKDYRRIATRFDKDVKVYFAALCIAAALIWWI